MMENELESEFVSLLAELRRPDPAEKIAVELEQPATPRARFRARWVL